LSTDVSFFLFAGDVICCSQHLTEFVRDPEARYFGGRVEEHSLVPLGEARLGRVGFDEWLRRSRAAA
jgi:hypothetical protein